MKTPVILAPASHDAKHTGTRRAVSPAICKAVADLRAALAAEAGCDFSFTVCVHGDIIAANNYSHGVVAPMSR